MERKLIKQGEGGCTIYVPKKWLDENRLSAGDRISINEEENKLVISTKDYKPPIKTTSLEIKKNDFHTYRGILGGMYRAGYQEIKISFKDMKVVQMLEKTSNYLFGFEVVDINQTGCTIKGIYKEEGDEIESFVQKIIHTIKVMQEIVLQDIKDQKYESKEELSQYRNNVLKYRDLIIRTIVKQKLLGNKHFPYHQIAFSLWNVARTYYMLYDNLDQKKKYSKHNLELLEKTNKFFTESFSNLKKRDLHSRFENYGKLRTEIFNTLNNQKETGIVAAESLQILIATHSADSSIAILNLE